MITEEQKRAIVEASMNRRAPKVGSPEWMFMTGHAGFPRSMNYEAVGRKLLMVDKLPEGATIGRGIKDIVGRLIIEEEYD